jgi:hypothetical protein
MASYGLSTTAATTNRRSPGWRPALLPARLLDRYGTGVHGDPLLADNHVGLVDPVLGISRRTRIHRIAIHDTYAASWHAPTWDRGHDSSYRIETASVVCGPWGLRCHLVEAPPRLGLVTGGWQVASEEPAVVEHTDDGAWAAAGDLETILVPLYGVARVDVALTEDTSPFGRFSATPQGHATRADQRSVHVMLVGLGRDLPAPPTRCSVLDGVVITRMPDDSTVVVALGESPARSPEVEGIRLDGDVRFARVPRSGPPVVLPW